MKIGFIGFGKLGQPCGEKIAEKGHNVFFYDTSNDIEYNPETTWRLDTIKDLVTGKDIVFVAVPTPHHPDYDGKAPTHHLPPKDFSYDTVVEVIKEANENMVPSQLLVLISTVLPGTVRERIAPLVTKTRFVYNPYLIAMGTVAWDMVNPEMVMIGTEDGSETGDAKELREFYETIMENDPRYVIGTWDDCECIKVFYNTFISAKIGLVNMIQDVAQRQGNIDVDVVTTALRDSTQRIMGPSYMKAGMGDGGACHPRDNIALRYMAEKLDLGYDLFDGIMKARDKQAKNMAIEVLRHGERVFFTSDSYKPGVPYTNGSYSILVQYYIEESGGRVVGEHDLPDVIFRVHETDDVPVINTAKVVFDPWRTFKSEEYTVIQYGKTR